MPPKKAVTEAATAKGEGLKPEETQFVFECLKAFGDDGVMDFSVLSRAAGHTNLMSTKNAFNRYKKRYGFGNIPTKIGAGHVAAKPDVDDGDESVLPSIETDALKPKSNGSKVTKKRGRPAAKATTAGSTAGLSSKKKTAAVSKGSSSINDASDEDNITEEDNAPASADVKEVEGGDDTD
ncbi:hypothetical protein UA08_00730 [Talaromyces atroroseus]|uniref:Uncharacterized protein n=1 Tax=Talaromyces atroroseus TaxID=1441469 RepID=A0A225AQ45_TALAT|nr:hypothetical protein UA08_00730 [Talaromyces atroroseus]OKL63752.1 hypothetical protein UA08_00730 [Talaromyces atroroseus]